MFTELIHFIPSHVLINLIFKKKSIAVFSDNNAGWFGGLTRTSVGMNNKGNRNLTVNELKY